MCRVQAYLVFQENFKSGCLCNSYECDGITTTETTTMTVATTTAPAKQALLLLSTYSSKNVPMVIDFEGKFIHIWYFRLKSSGIDRLFSLTEKNFLSKLYQNFF